MIVGTHKHWHDIADFFRVVHQHGRRLVAWERAAAVRKNVAKEMRTTMPGRLDRTATAFHMPISAVAPAAPPAEDAQILDEHPHGIDLVEVRSDVRSRIKELKRLLAASLSEREVHHVLFPVVVFSDEFFLKATMGGTAQWEPLQSELYEVENGGEMFYEKLDTLIMKDDTHPFVLEVYYFCLSDGFVGMYEDDQARIGQIKAKIAQRIPVPNVNELAVPNAVLPVTLVPFPWKIYAGAAIAVVVFFLICVGVGAAEHTRYLTKFMHADDSETGMR